MAKFLLVAALLAGLWMLLRKPAPRRGGGSGASVDEREARAVLGVSPTADADAIRAAHRRLVAAVHPDKGGSAELARRINAARDVLLDRRD